MESAITDDNPTTAIPASDFVPPIETPAEPNPTVSPTTSPKAVRAKKDKKEKKPKDDGDDIDKDKDKDKDPEKAKEVAISVSEAHAARAMRYFLAAQLASAGFDGASGDDVMWELERTVLQCEPLLSSAL